MGSKDKPANNLMRCQALVDAGIVNPDSQEGIDFCIDKCPYPDKCEIFDSDTQPRK